MAAISEAMTVLDVVACPPAPIAHLAVIFAPGMYGTVANSNLGSTTSFALEVGSLVHVAINAMANAGYGVGGRKSVRTPVHG